MHQQAQKIVNKFGGVPRLAAAIGKNRTTVNRWLYPKDRGGTNGLIPSQAWPEILAAAKREHIPLTPEDLAP